jgi:hypothetical protein
MTTTDWAYGDVFLTIRRDPRWYRRLKPIKATNKRPTSVPADAVVVKVKLRMPLAAFKPLEPEAVVTVPEELVQQPVHVEAVASDG